MFFTFLEENASLLDHVTFATHAVVLTALLIFVLSKCGFFSLDHEIEYANNHFFTVILLHLVLFMFYFAVAIVLNKG